jgi:hypothetical protein
MTKPTLQVISGGAHLSAAEIDAAIAAITFEAIMDRSVAEQFAERAEAGAAMAAELITAAVAIMAKSKEQLVSMISACDQGDAVEGHEALKEALAAADTLVAVLRAAEARFTIALATAAIHSR